MDVESNTSFAVKFARGCDYVPGVSTVSNLAEIITKVVLETLNESTLKQATENPLIRDIHQKSYGTCAVLAIPILNIFFAILWDRWSDNLSPIRTPIPEPESTSRPESPALREPSPPSVDAAAPAVETVTRRSLSEIAASGAEPTSRPESPARREPSPPSVDTAAPAGETVTHRSISERLSSAVVGAGEALRVENIIKLRLEDKLEREIINTVINEKVTGRECNYKKYRERIHSQETKPKSDKPKTKVRGLKSLRKRLGEEYKRKGLTFVLAIDKKYDEKIEEFLNKRENREIVQKMNIDIPITPST